jgi:hypothetical protein
MTMTPTYVPRQRDIPSHNHDFIWMNFIPQKFKFPSIKKIPPYSSTKNSSNHPLKCQKWDIVHRASSMEFGWHYYKKSIGRWNKLYGWQKNIDMISLDEMYFILSCHVWTSIPWGCGFDFHFIKIDTKKTWNLNSKPILGRRV